MNNLTVTIPLLIIALVLSVVASLHFGSADLPITQVIACLFNQCQSPMEEILVWQLRIPRILVAIAAGSGLACAGAILQNTTRNTLADPYIFGIVSGAGLGATLAHIFLAKYIAIALPLAAFLGALASIAIVIVVTQIIQRVDQVLLAGVAVSFMFAAITQFLLYLAEPFATNRILFWLMGSLANVTMTDFSVIMTLVIVAIVLMLVFHRSIDALLLGDDSAQSLGVSTKHVRMLMFGLCAAMTATIVAYCGGIGFVGLMIPHIVRALIGVRIVPLLLGSALLGAIFLIWVDVIARSALNQVEIPIGIITAALGSVFFLIVMSKQVAK